MWHSLVEHGNLRETTPKDNRIRIQKIDDGCQPAGETVGVARERCAALRVSALGSSSDLGGGQALPGMPMVIGGKPGPDRKVSIHPERPQ